MLRDENLQDFFLLFTVILNVVYLFKELTFQKILVKYIYRELQ